MPKNTNKWWKIQNLAQGRAEVWIYDIIGQDYWGEAISAKDLCQQLAKLDVSQIDVRINSPGGSIPDGIAIYNALKRHPASVDTYNDSEASSIASVIMLAGERRVMSKYATFMVHDPWGVAVGSSEEMRKAADVLDTCKEIIVSAYVDHSNLTADEVAVAMSVETWYTAEEALAAGFITEIGEEMKLAACDFKKAHQALRFRKTPPTNARRKPENLVVQTTVWTGDEENPAEEAQETPEEEAAEQSCYCTGCPPEMACTDCAAADTCINPSKTTTNAVITANLSITTTAPQAAHTQEVTAMPQITVVAPAAGERNHQQDAADIVGMCVRNNCADRAAGFIQNGLTPDQVGRQLLDLQASGAIATPSAENSAAIDLGKDAKRYSFQRAIMAAVDMREGRQAAGFEVDVHQDLLRTMPQNFQSKGGIIVPMRLNTSLTSGGSGTGAEVVRNEYGDLIEILRNQAVTTRLGAKLLTGLKGPLTFPKQTGTSTLVWTGEAPAQGVTESNVSLGIVTLSPKTAMAKGSISRNLLLQSTPDAEGIVQNDLAAVASLGIDLAAIHGTGANNQPTGIYTASGVNLKAMGGVPTYGMLIDQITECAKDNALLGNYGWATTPGMAGKMMQTLTAEASGAKFVWEGTFEKGTMCGYQAMASNQVSSVLGTGNDEHGIVFGSWDQLMIGQWGGIEVTVDPYTLADQGLIRLILFLMVDIQNRYPEAFSKSTGAKVA